MPKPSALQRLVDSGMHRVVNRKLHDLRRGGFGTVDRPIYTRYLTSLIEQGEITADDIHDMVKTAVAEAIIDHEREAERRMSWLRHEVAGVAERIDSLALYTLVTRWANEEHDPETQSLLDEALQEARHA